MNVPRRLTSNALRSLRGRLRTSVALVDRRSSRSAPDEDPAHVAALLRRAGLETERWTIPQAGFADYLRDADYPPTYHGGEGRLFGQKTLEHYASIALAEIAPSDVVVDVASNGGPFVDIVRCLTGAECYENDLQFPPGVHGQRIGGDAAAMPVPDGFADVMTLHCSFDHFEGPADTGYVRDAARVLRAGGRVVILPLYLTDVYGAKVDPRLRLTGLRLDPGMRRFLMPGLDVRFSRLYDPPRLEARVLRPAMDAGLVPTLLRVEGGEALVPGSYLNYALLLRKP